MSAHTYLKLTDVDIDKIAARVVEMLREGNLVTPDRVMDAKAAAEYLHISTKTLYNLKDKIPRKKYGRKCFYTEKSLLDFLYK